MTTTGFDHNARHQAILAKSQWYANAKYSTLEIFADKNGLR